MPLICHESNWATFLHPQKKTWSPLLPSDHNICRHFPGPTSGNAHPMGRHGSSTQHLPSLVSQMGSPTSVESNRVYDAKVIHETRLFRWWSQAPRSASWFSSLMNSQHNVVTILAPGSTPAPDSSNEALLSGKWAPEVLPILEDAIKWHWDCKNHTLYISHNINRYIHACI